MAIYVMKRRANGDHDEPDWFSGGETGRGFEYLRRATQVVIGSRIS